MNLYSIERKEKHLSFLQLSEVSPSSDLNANGKLVLNSNKLNCACKFVQGYGNNSIDTNKQLSTLPQFKEIQKNDSTVKDEELSKEMNHEQQLKAFPPKIDENEKNNMNLSIDKKLRIDSKNDAFLKKKEKKRQLQLQQKIVQPIIPDKNQDFSSWIQLNKMGDWPGAMKYPTYKQLLGFYLRKKREMSLNSMIYTNDFDLY